MSSFEVFRFDFEQFASTDSPLFDILISVVGFEARGRHLLEKVSAERFGRIYAYQYEHNRVGSYNVNRDFFVESGAELVEVPDGEYFRNLRGRLSDLQSDWNGDADHVFRIAVDISCMDRDRIGHTVRALLEADCLPLEVAFVYSVGSYDAHLVGSEGVVRVNRAISGFDGWTDDPTVPVVAVIGCGVESRLALAAVETLEPTEVLWLVPEGEDSAYDSLIAERNSFLFEGSKSSPYYYPVVDPYLTITELHATVSAIRLNWRVVLVPLGPKILALCCVLIAMLFDTNVSVWRLSADDQRTPEERLPSGTIVGLLILRTPDYA